MSTPRPRLAFLPPVSAPLALLGLGLFLLLTPVRAFPPAPYYTLYGTIRDQVGQSVSGRGADLILLRGNQEVARAPIGPIYADHNYELNIRIDANLPDARIYDESAISAEALFSLAVEMDGQLFYPIEASDGLTAGKGGERLELDLTLGEDADRDGLPDVWEEWQLHLAGLTAGPDGWDLSLLSRDGDFDKDGFSDWVEYLAGTLAGDASERFELAIEEVTDSLVLLEFYGITGKTYTIEGSTDLENWAPVPFSLTESGTAVNSLEATAVGVQSVYCPRDPSGRTFYRLTVQ